MATKPKSDAAARALIETARKNLQRSERGARALLALRALLSSPDIYNLDSVGKDSVRILVLETLGGRSAWLYDGRNV